LFFIAFLLFRHLSNGCFLIRFAKSYLYGMSGFFGIFSPSNKVDRVAFDQMLEYARKGSFEGVETVESDYIAMGHMMLRVSPEAEYDQQPLQSDCGRYLVTGHFRLDYRDELGDKLGFGFQELKKMPDSLLALLAFQKWKENCVHHLEGDWAFVLHDKTENKLFMAKDKTGVSALFYIMVNDQVYFSSNTLTILAVKSHGFQVNEENLFRYTDLGFFPLKSETLIKNLYYVNPGEYVSYDYNFKVKSRAYWNLNETKLIFYKQDSDYVYGLFSTYVAAIRTRLNSKNHIGIFLSGGLDSTSVAAIASLELKKNDRELLSYTSFPHYEEKLPINKKIISNEVKLVQEVVSKYGNITPQYLDFPDFYLGAELNSCQVEDPYYPILSRNNFWINGILNLARGKNIRRMLTGQAGNYSITWTSPYVYASILYRARFHSLWKIIKSDIPISNKNFLSFFLTYVLKPLKSKLFSIYFSKPKSTSKLILNHLNESFLKKYAHLINIDSSSTKSRKNIFFEENAERKIGLHRLISLTGIKLSSEAEINQMEVVDPTADSRLIGFTLSIPERMFYRSGLKKYIFKIMMENLIPNNVLNNNYFKVQSHDYAYRIQSDDSLDLFFDEEAKIKEQSSLINIIKLKMLYSSIKKNPEKFIMGSGIKVFLNCLSLYKFQKRFR